MMLTQEKKKENFSIVFSVLSLGEVQWAEPFPGDLGSRSFLQVLYFFCCVIAPVIGNALQFWAFRCG